MKTLFTENVALKLMALILAILLKIYFYSADNHISQTLKVPIVLMNVPSNMIITEPVDIDKLQAEIGIRGPKPLVEQAKELTDNINIILPPFNPKESTKEHLIKLRKNITVSTGVDIVEVNPEEIKLVFERALEKQALVKVNTVGRLPSGYRIEEIKVTPDSVRIRGPESKLKELNEVSTEEIDISQYSSNPGLLQLSLLNLGQHIKYLDTDSVQVELNITPIIEQKTFQNLPVKVVAPGGFAATVEPSRAVAKLEGPIRVLDSLNSKELELVADGSSLSAGEHKAELTIRLPATVKNIRLLETQPRQVTVRLVNQDG